MAQGVVALGGGGGSELGGTIRLEGSNASATSNIITIGDGLTSATGLGGVDVGGVSPGESSLDIVSISSV